jgi:hypothetical protein
MSAGGDRRAHVVSSGAPPRPGDVADQQRQVDSSNFATLASGSAMVGEGEVFGVRDHLIFPPAPTTLEGRVRVSHADSVQIPADPRSSTAKTAASVEQGSGP